MRKIKLFLSLLMVMMISVGNVWADKVTAVANIESGKKYYIGATKSDNSDWYLSVADNGTVTGKKQGTAVSASDPTNAAVFTFTSTSGGWTIQFESGKYLTLPTTKDNGKVYVQDDAANWTITNVSAKALMNFKIGNFCLQRNSSSSLNFGSYASGQLDLWLEPVSSGDPDVCATPTFNPAAGAVLSGTTVAISCSTDGATIHYTTNGTSPTTSSPTYSAPIAINSNTTIKAIAVKNGMSNSAEATAAYTIATPLTTMQAIFDAATSTATPTYITFSDAWVVTGVSTNGKSVYITDGEKGMILYNNSGNMGLAVGNTLSGTVQRSLKLYNGAAELDPFTTEGLTKGTADLPAVQELDAEGIEALSGVNTGSLIKISGTAIQDGTKYYVAGVQLYNTLSTAYTNPTAGKNYNCTGVYLQFNSTKEILPRSAADVEEITEEGAPEAPEFSVAEGEYTSVQTVELSCATDGATIYYTTDGTTPDNTKTQYTAAITVDANMTVKAIAIKNDKESSIASAAYTINMPADPEVTCTWDLSAESYVADPEPTADLIQWTSTYVTMKAEKNGGNTGVNNYIPPTRTSTRFYTSNKITFIPANSKQITTIVITAASSGYATALKNATWTNATAAASDTEVTITATGAGNVVGVLGSNTGITAVTVNYEPYVAPATYAVAFATPDHGTLTISNGDDPIASGDEFEEGTELTVSTEPASGYILDAIKVIETGSDPENDVTSTVLSGSTLTVPAYAITVSATFVENVSPVATLTLSENGVAAPFAGEHHQGDVVNLPLTSSAECVKEFVGWSANASCAVAPEYAPGAEYTLASTSQTLYAVYATASGTSYVKTALANIASGSEVVVTEAKTVEEVLTIWALTYNTTSKKTIASVVTDAENVLDVEGLSNGFWILTKDGDNFSLTAKGTTDKLYCTNTNDGVRVGEGEANTFSINNEYLYTSATSDARYLGVYNATDFRCYTSINSNIKDQTLAFYKKTATYSDYATTCVAALADPVFTPAAGVYTEAKNVVITAEEGTIYYTTDGTDPTSSSAEYTAPIVLDANGTTTIKAIAISATSQSAIVNATYTINLPLSTMDQIFEAATAAGSTATDANIAFGNWVVSGVSTNGKNVFVTDGTKGFIIFDNGGEMGFAVGDVLSGTVACKVQLYKGAAELTTLSSTTDGLNIAKEGVITPVVKAISALSGINTGAPVTINSVQFDGEFLTDGVNSIKPFNSLFAYDALENGKYYNVTGIYQQFDATKEILPRSAADIEAVNLDDPELSYSPASVSLEVGQALSAPTFNNPHDVSPINYAVSGDAVATVTNEGVIALVENATGTATITASFAGNAQYAAGNATFTITVTPASVSENVVIIAEYDSKFYALTNSISNKTAAAVEIEKDGDKIVVPSNEAKVAIQWTKRTSGENTTFQDANDKYLKGVSNGGDLTVVDAVCNWSWNATDEYYYIGSRSFIYRESANGFKNYAVSNAGSSDYSTIAEVRVIDPANIVVTSKVDPELAYTPAEVTLTVGGEFTPAVLGYAEGFDGLAAVTYESSNLDLATVEGGVVSLVADATGTATITATFAGNNNYLAGSASYTITVNEAGDDLTGTWKRVTAVAAGQKIIIAGTYNDKTMAMGKQNTNNRAAVLSTLDEDVLTPGTATKVFTLVDAGDGKYAIQATNGKYLYAAGTGDKNYLKEADNYDELSAKWTITFDANGANVVASSSNRNTLRYNSTSNSELFSCYATGGQRAINIYSTTEVIRGSLEAGKWGTICPTYEIQKPAGASFYTLTYADKNGDVPSAVYFDEIAENASLEAGKPYLFIADGAAIIGTKNGEATSVLQNYNGFTGVLAEERLYVNADDAAAHKYYIIKGNRVQLCGEGYFTIPAERAYIDMSVVNTQPSAQAPGRRRVVLTNEEAQVATGMDALNAAEAPVKVMINGQIFILRGEKMYDATGRLVK